MIRQSIRSGRWRPAAVSVYVGLGANLGDPQHQIDRAIIALHRLPRTRVVAVSAIYRTAPVGPQDQPDYLNAVAALSTRLGPAALLGRLQSIEQSLGRVRDGKRWGPRMLDLDLLLYGQLCLESPDLRLPHPWMHRRGFVLVPLADIAPAELLVPGRGRLEDLLVAVDRGGIQRLGDARAEAKQSSDTALAAQPQRLMAG